MRKVHFTKMHGAGNDFVLVDDRAGEFPADDHLRVAAMASARTGIGCEGVILVQNSDVADFRMLFFNPDGTAADLCGNGARCVAAFAREIGAVKSPAMTFETRAGLIDAEIVGEGRVRVWMPEPRNRRYGLDVNGTAGDFVVAGVPHFVVSVKNAATVDVDGLGRALRLPTPSRPTGRTWISCSTCRRRRRTSALTSAASRRNPAHAALGPWRRPWWAWKRRGCACPSASAVRRGTNSWWKATTADATAPD